MSNTVSVTQVSEEDATSVAGAASQLGEMWLARYIKPLRGMVIIYATPADAEAAQARLHGLMVGNAPIAASMGRKLVPREEVDNYNMTAPKRVVQLISPPPSPPEWWAGWKEEEEGPKTPPELMVEQEELRNSDVRKRELNILATNLFEAVQQESEKLPESRVPRLTIECPPESITGLPEGFSLREK